MVSFPTYDPNLLANHDTSERPSPRRCSTPSPEKPRLPRAYQERFFPGSTFKVVTATAGILHGGVTADEPVYPVTQRLHAARHHPPDPQLRRQHLRRRAASRSCACRATPPSPRWASTPAPTR